LGHGVEQQSPINGIPLQLLVHFALRNGSLSRKLFLPLLFISGDILRKSATTLSFGDKAHSSVERRRRKSFEKNMRKLYVEWPDTVDADTRDRADIVKLTLLHVRYYYMHFRTSVSLNY